MDCVVRDNCLVPYDDCWMCDFYQMYQPRNINILSPRQEEKKAQRKAAKKVKKISDASKRGKANRRNGRNAERELVKWFSSIGLDSNLVPMSGGLKRTGVISVLADDETVRKMCGDIKLRVKDKEYTIECKRNINTDGLYKKADAGLILIDGFAYLLRQEMFQSMMAGVKQKVDKTVADKGYKQIHKYFEQDNSDIVVISRPYMHRLFFIKEDVYEELNGGNENEL